MLNRITKGKHYFNLLFIYLIFIIINYILLFIYYFLSSYYLSIYLRKMKDFPICPMYLISRGSRKNGLHDDAGARAADDAEAEAHGRIVGQVDDLHLRPVAG